MLTADISFFLKIQHGLPLTAASLKVTDEVFHRLFLRNLFPSVSIKCHLMISGQDHFHSHFCAVSDRNFPLLSKHRDFHLSTVRRLVSLCRYVASADPDIFRISAIILWPAGRTDARAAGSDVHTLSHLPALPSPHMNKDFYRSFRPSSPLILSPWFILTINSFLEIQEVLIVMSTFLNIATPAFLW